MVRLTTVLLLIVSIVLSGCGTSQQVVNGSGSETQQSDPFKVPPDDRSPLARWMDEHNVASNAGMSLLIVGGIVLTGVLVYAIGMGLLIGNWH